MPGGSVPAVVAGVVTCSGEPALNVTLECDGEVTSRGGEETVSRFFPAMANSLSSVDCADMVVNELVVNLNDGNEVGGGDINFVEKRRAGDYLNACVYRRWG